MRILVSRHDIAGICVAFFSDGSDIVVAGLLTGGG